MEMCIRDRYRAVLGGSHIDLSLIHIFYSVFNPISVVRYQVDSDTCTRCGTCAHICKMGCDPVKNANSLECIRCGACKAACPAGAIHIRFQRRTKPQKADLERSQ